MKKFELPYNFDNDYFAFLNHYQDYFKYIKFIYMPAFKEGNIQNSRETSGILEKTNYTDYNKYSDIIKRFQSLDLDVCILIQKNATVDIIKKYINEFNIKYFVINDDTLATTLKELYSDKIYLILSITRRITYNDIMKKDFSMYDEICLDFWFNRHIDKIKKLPTKYKYSILVNSVCCPFCTKKNSEEHWFDNNWHDCIKKDTIEIFPADLIYFEPYITSYKCVDRTYKSAEILNSFKDYIKGYENINKEDYRRGPEDYYNIKLKA